jgi:hypothetical protein
MSTLERKHYDKFDAMIAFGNPNGNASLKYFLNDGRIETISQYKSIGTGLLHGKFFLNQL